jgi:Protein of unknown function (DUF669)
MKFHPLSDKEIAQLNLIPEGTYTCEVVDAINKISTKGNEMIELKLKIVSEKEKNRIMFDWLLSAFPKKLKHFCQHTGLIKHYDAGDLNATDCMGKLARIQVKITKSTNGEDWTKVEDYLAFDGKEIHFKDDDISF